MKPKFSFEPGEIVRIKTGPFQAFTARVKEVDDGKGRLKVLVSIFGRYEPIELGFLDVEKLSLTQNDN
jgi:transcriptional antiterminator NusG